MTSLQFPPDGVLDISYVHDGTLKTCNLDVKDGELVKFDCKGINLAGEPCTFALRDYTPFSALEVHEGTIVPLLVTFLQSLKHGSGLVVKVSMSRNGLALERSP
jgi:hypothetical protein